MSHHVVPESQSRMLLNAAFAGHGVAGVPVLALPTRALKVKPKKFPLAEDDGGFNAVAECDSELV